MKAARVRSRNILDFFPFFREALFALFLLFLASGPAWADRLGSGTAVEAGGGYVASGGESGVAFQGAFLVPIDSVGRDDGVAFSLKPSLSARRYSVSGQMYWDTFVLVSVEVAVVDPERYSLPFSEFLMPYASIGGGMERLSPSIAGPGDSDSGAVIDLGVGLRFFVTEDIYAVINSAYTRGFGDVEADNFQLTAGLGLLLIPSSPPVHYVP